MANNRELSQFASFVSADSGRVGINTDTFPDARDSFIVAPPSGQTDVFFTIKTLSTNGNTRLQFADPDDTNVGDISYTHSNNAMVFKTADTERARIDSSGNLGLGESSSIDARLHVNSGTDNTTLFLESTDGDVNLGMADNAGSCRLLQAGGNLRFRTGGNANAFGTGDNERMILDSNGNLGINRTDPNQRLNVSGNIEVNAYDNTGGGGGYNTSNGLIIGNLYDAGKSYTGSDDRTACIWQERGLDLDFATNDTLKMKITYDGKVGVGTNVPARLLHLHESNSNEALITFTTPTTGATSSDGFRVGMNGSEEALVWNNESGIIKFGTANTERIRITSDGKTGIGGITPQNLLNVNATGSMGLYGTTTGKVGHSIRFIRKYGSSATHNFAVVDGASPRGQSRLGGFVATYTYRSAYGFDSDGGGHGIKMLSGRVRDSGEWGFDDETNAAEGNSPRPTLQGVDNNDGTCTLQVVNPSSTHSYGEFHIVAWDCQITTPST